MAEPKVSRLQFMQGSTRSVGFLRANCRGPGNAEIIGETRPKPQIAIEASRSKGVEIPYCAVSVKITTGCPNAYWPSAFTCTVPAEEGNVRTTEALPLESVVTI